MINDLQDRNLGLQLHVFHASTEDAIKGAFESLTGLRTEALIIAPDGLFARQDEQLARLALHHRIPAVYSLRSFAISGGLMSYGAIPAEACRILGVYTGRILNGEKPEDLPVHQVTKIELTINLKTATALGIIVPASLLARADEVIE